MPHITVSRRTHERIEKASLSGSVAAKHFKANPDGTVTFWIDEQVKSRLDKISPDAEAAIIRTLDCYEGRKSGN